MFVDNMLVARVLGNKKLFCLPFAFLHIIKKTNWFGNMAGCLVLDRKY